MELKTDISYSDDWLKQKDTTGWQVLLNTGKMVYEDDNRPGYYHSAWERLCLHCKETGEYPTDMWVKFRSHVEHVASNKDGFYFFKAILNAPSWKKQEDYYIAGYLENGIIKCKKWKVPEIIVYEEFERDPPGGLTPVFQLPALIRKPNV